MKSLANLLLLVLVPATTCPPKGWDRCGGQWPPSAGGYCCSKAGWLGISAKHCQGTSALKKCCWKNLDGSSLTCKTKGKKASEKKGCPPEGWERCGGKWPPAADGYCCSKAGYLGKSVFHCKYEGINALKRCCKKGSDG